MDEVRPRAGALEALEQADRAEGVEGEGLVEGLLEGDRRRAVDDGVDPRPARRPSARPSSLRSPAIARIRLPSPSSAKGSATSTSSSRRRRASSSEGALSSTTSRSIPSPWRSSAASTALPRNPEAPVTRTLLPASLSRTRWFPSLVTGAILGIAPVAPARPRVRNCAAPPPKWTEVRPQYNFPQWRAERDGDDAGRIPRSGKRSWSRSGSCSPRSRSPPRAAGTWAIDVYNSAPPLSSLQPVQKGRSSAIYAADGSLIGFIRSSNIRQPVSTEQLPDDLKEATVAIEDRGFFDHGAVDFAGDRPRRAQEHRGGGHGRGGLDDHPAAGPQPLHPASRTDDQAKADRSAPRLRGGGSALEDLDPHRLPEHGALRDGRRPDRGRRRGGGADLLRQAGQGPDPDRGGADRRPAAGALRIQPLPRPAGGERTAQRGARRDGGGGLHHLLRTCRGAGQRPRPQPGRQVQGDPRPLPLRPRPAGADRQIRDQHGPQRRPQGLHDDRPRTPGTRRGSGRIVQRLLPRRRPGRRPRLGRPGQRRDRRPRLDRRLRDRKPVQLRLAGAPAAGVLVQDLRPDDRDQAGDRPRLDLLRRHLADDPADPRRRPTGRSTTPSPAAA